MSRRNVELLISARDDASRVLTTVEKTLRSLGEAKANIEKRSSGLNRAMAQTVSSAAKLGAAFGQDLESDLKAAGTAMGRLEKNLSDAKAALIRKQDALQKNRQAHADLRNQLKESAAALKALEAQQQGSGTKELTNDIRQQRAQHSGLEKDLARVEAQLGRTRTEVSKAVTKFKDLDTTVGKARGQFANLKANLERQDVSRAFREGIAPVRRYGSEVERTAAKVAGLRAPTMQAKAATSELALSLSNARSAISLWGDDTRKSLSLGQRLRGEFIAMTTSVLGFYAALNLGGTILESFNQIEAAQTRLAAAFDGDYDEVGAEMERLNQEAERLGISFDVLSDNYSKFIISGQQAGLETDTLRKIFTQVTEAGRVLKLSNDQISGTLTALTQIAGKGTLQMEELRQQLGDRLPGAVGLVAKALGYAENEISLFYKAVENGQVGAREALVALGQGLEDTYGGQVQDALDQTAAKVGRFQNLLFNRRLTSANSGFIDGLETALDALNAWLESDEGIQFFEDLGAAMGNMLEIAAQVPQYFDEIGTGLKFLVAVGAARAVVSLARGFVTLAPQALASAAAIFQANAATLALSTGAARGKVGLSGLIAVMVRTATTGRGLMTVLRALSAAAGGWPALLGVAATALAFFAIDGFTRADETTSEFNATLMDTEETVRRVSTAFRESKGDVAEFERRLEGLTKLDVKLDLGKLRADLNTLRKSGRDVATNTNSEIGAIMNQMATALPTDSNSLGLYQLLLQWDEGSISARDFRQEVAQLSERLQGMAELDTLHTFLDGTNSRAESLETQIDQLEATLAVLEGTATPAQEAMLGLRDTLDSANETTDQGAAIFGEFTEAMRTLGENIPSVNRKLKELDAVEKIEADFKAAMEAAEAFGDEAERAARRAEAIRLRGEALTDWQGRNTNFEARYTAARGTPEGEKMAELVAAAVREGLRLGIDAKDILTAISYETGGTLDPWKKGPTTQWGEHRGLIQWGEPQRERYGVSESSTISEQMKAVGDYLIDAGVKSGDGLLQVYAAINAGSADRIHASDANNGGAPGTVLDKVQDQMAGHQRRADGLLATYAGVQEATEKSIKDNERLAEQQDRFREQMEARLEASRFESEIEGMRLVDAEVLKAIRDAELQAQKVGLQLTQEQRAEIEAVTRAQFASAQAEEDRNTRLEKARELESEVNLLVQRRQLLIEQIESAQAGGDFLKAAGLSEGLTEVEEKLETATEKAIAFWQAMGGPESEAAIVALQQTQQSIKETGSSAVEAAKQITGMISEKMTQAFERFSQAVAEGQDPIEAFGQSFRQMASEILIELGRMIVKQVTYNLVAGAVSALTGIPLGAISGGGGAGGGVQALFRHKGGMVGDGTGTSGRKFDPSIFANATRYHNGGIAGLAPREVPAILERDEEVLTRSDPRHALNGGKQAASGSQQPAEMTIINTFDAEEAMERALTTPGGRRVLLNAVRADRAEFKAALS